MPTEIANIENRGYQRRSVPELRFQMARRKYNESCLAECAVFSPWETHTDN